MLVLHVYIQGRGGYIERTYDFLRNDGKEAFEGCDLVIPYDDQNDYPISELDALAILSNQELAKGDH